jgi:TetR/AcrR family transcriptional regulator
MATTQRRLGVDGAKNRDLLVEAAAYLLVEEGYAAITARRVAEQAGFKVQLVYYYFQSMDDLMEAVVRRNAAKRMERLEAARQSPRPLQALWELNSDPAAAITTSELLALANHRRSIRNEIVTAARQFRTFQIELVAELMDQRGIDPTLYPPGAIVTIVAALARAFAQDSALGVSEGYDDALSVVTRGMRLFDEPALQEDGNDRG